MLNHIIALFSNLFSACLSFSDIVILLTACCLFSVVVTVFIYLLRGKY